MKTNLRNFIKVAGAAGTCIIAGGMVSPDNEMMHPEVTKRILLKWLI